MKCPECSTELIENVEICQNCGYQIKKKKAYTPISIVLLAIMFIVAIIMIFAIVGNKSNGKPVPFTDVDWDATQNEVIDAHGTPDDEYDNDIYGHMVVYYGIEYEGYSGQAKFCFKEDKLHAILFYIDEYDIETVKYFNELYESKYGEADFSNEAGTVWSDDKANYGVSSSPLVGGFINCLFSKPTDTTVTDDGSFPWWGIIVAVVVVGVVVTITVTRKNKSITIFNHLE